jgi:hypothetical protein
VRRRFRRVALSGTEGRQRCAAPYAGNWAFQPPAAAFGVDLPSGITGIPGTITPAGRTFTADVTTTNLGRAPMLNARPSLDLPAGWRPRGVLPDRCGAVRLVAAEPDAGRRQGRRLARRARHGDRDVRDTLLSPLGARGIGEFGIVGAAGAVANAVYNATGKRVRDLPITLEKLLT